MMHSTHEPLERFGTEGYQVLPQVLPPRWLDAVGATIQAQIDQGALGPPPEDETELWSISDMIERVPELGPLLLDASLMALPEALIGAPLRMVSNRYVYKPAGCHEFVPWHRDNEEYGGTAGDRGVTLWIPLVDVDPDNGCLWYVAGSHRPEAARVPPTCAPMGRGDLAVHSMGTLHFAGSNRSASGRPTVVLELMRADTIDPRTGALLACGRAIEAR